MNNQKMRIENYITFKYNVKNHKNSLEKILHIGTKKDKDDAVKEIISYQQLVYYKDRVLHDIADGKSKEKEISDYIYEQNYGYDNDCNEKNLIFKKTILSHYDFNCLF